MMKKNLFFIGMISFVLIFGMLFIGCGNPAGDDNLSENNNSQNDDENDNNQNSDDSNNDNQDDDNDAISKLTITIINFIDNNGIWTFSNGDEMKLLLLDDNDVVKASAIGTIADKNLTVEITPFDAEGDYYFAIVHNGGSSDGMGICSKQKSPFRISQDSTVTINTSGYYMPPILNLWRAFPGN